MTATRQAKESRYWAVAQSGPLNPRRALLVDLASAVHRTCRHQVLVPGQRCSRRVGVDLSTVRPELLQLLDGVTPELLHPLRGLIQLAREVIDAILKRDVWLFKMAFLPVSAG